MPQKQIPNFSTEAEERQFWNTHESTEYIDWTKRKTITFPNLKPSVERDEARDQPPTR